MFFFYALLHKFWSCSKLEDICFILNFLFVNNLISLSKSEGNDHMRQVQTHANDQPPMINVINMVVNRMVT